MMHITKGDEPKEWTDYCSQNGACWDDIPTHTKNLLKLALLIDQGYVCCYCGQRIELNLYTKIEHLLPKGKDHFPELALKYSNLLCSCDGGQEERRSGNRKYPQYCDDAKNESILLLTPLDDDCEVQFSFDDEGQIKGETDKAKQAIVVLNLENKVLQNRRKAAIDVYRDLDFVSEQWQEELCLLRSKDSKGKYMEFCFVCQKYIEKYKC